MPADCFVISGHNLYGYTHYEKVNPEELAKHIRSILSQNGYTGLTVTGDPAASAEYLHVNRF